MANGNALEAPALYPVATFLNNGDLDSIVFIAEVCRDLEDLVVGLAAIKLTRVKLMLCFHRLVKIIDNTLRLGGKRCPFRVVGGAKLRRDKDFNPGIAVRFGWPATDKIDPNLVPVERNAFADCVRVHPADIKQVEAVG